MNDVIIVGGGPAGLTAAIYSSRRGLNTLVLSADIGGQIAKTSEIGNYPGLNEISGADLAMKFKEQAEKYGTKLNFEQVKNIIKKENNFAVATSSNKYQTKTIILAYGKKPRPLNVSGEAKLVGKGVTYCATCDAPFFRDKTVVVVGGGNCAADAAILSAKFAKKVYLINRSELSCEQILSDKVKAEERIEIVVNDQIKEIFGRDKVERVSLESGRQIDTDGVIVEIGFEMNSDLTGGLVDLDERNQTKISANQETSTPGIYAAGDSTTTPFKQVVIAAGEGAKAALSAYDYIQKQSGKKGLVADWH
jgi:thioredoxin-disulfide reductase